jgi:hypothetical protein
MPAAAAVESCSLIEVLSEAVDLSLQVVRLH